MGRTENQIKDLQTDIRDLQSFVDRVNKSLIKQERKLETLSSMVDNIITTTQSEINRLTELMEKVANDTIRDHMELDH